MEPFDRPAVGVALLLAGLALPAAAQETGVKFPRPPALTSEAEETEGFEETLRKTGDVLQYALPSAALGATLIARDAPGRGQWALSTGFTVGTARLIKIGAAKLRPSGSSRSSFPSGHTAAAFSGAAFLQRRYGAATGVPAYALATVTGVSRVIADAHFADDVLAGASIAQMSAWLWVRPRDQSETADPDRPRWGYEFSFGPAFVGRNIVGSPGATGDPFDLAGFEKIDDPTTTAVGTVRFQPSPAHRLTLMFAPFESRDRGTFASDTRFAGEVFGEGAPLRSAYRHYTLRGSYIFSPSLARRLITSVGAELDLTAVAVELEGSGGEKEASVSTVALLPIAYGALGVWVTPRVDVLAEFSGASWATDELVDLRASVGVRLGSRWGVRAGYALFDREVATSELSNEVSYDAIFVAFSRGG